MAASRKETVLERTCVKESGTGSGVEGDRRRNQPTQR